MDQEIQASLYALKCSNDVATAALKQDLLNTSADLSHRLIALETKINQLDDMRDEVDKLIDKQNDLIEELERRLADVNSVFGWENAILNGTNI